MARYINGDIQHKFWFGTQSSDAASQFGGQMEQSSIPYYYDLETFNKEALEDLLKIVNEKYKLNVNLKTNPEELYADETWKAVQDDENVADVQLGLRIYQHLLEHGDCQFEAEL